MKLERLELGYRAEEGTRVGLRDGDETDEVTPRDALEARTQLQPVNQAEW